MEGGEILRFAQNDGVGNGGSTEALPHVILNPAGVKNLATAGGKRSPRHSEEAKPTKNLATAWGETPPLRSF